MRRSEQVGDLVAALTKAQPEFGAAIKNKDNPFYRSRYADLGSVVDAVAPALNKHGIALMHLPSTDMESQTAIMEVMLIKGDQWISVTLEAPATAPAGKDNADTPPNRQLFNVQTIGKAWTYLRRVGTLCICGVAPEDEDDDGNSLAPQHAPKPSPKPAPKPAPRPVSNPADVDVRGRFFAAAAKLGWTQPDTMAYLAAEHPEMEFNQIPVHQLKDALDAMAEESPISYFGAKGNEAK